MGGWLGGCTRHADIGEDPYDMPTVVEIPRGDEEAVPVDAGLAGPGVVACENRSAGECQGQVDFPCDFYAWAESSVRGCFRAGGCQADGWVDVELGSDGCVREIRMEEPSQELADCLGETVRATRCPCDAMVRSIFLGVGNDGCEDQPLG
jgi:hypothetical protein